MNVMLESSGRDVGMFHYLNHFFPSSQYQKMVVHFSINDIRFAEESVARRMANEIRHGKAAACAMNEEGKRVINIRDIIASNAGGPYGPNVLRQVEAESNAIWESVAKGNLDIAHSWYKASLNVVARHDGDWTVQVQRPSGGDTTSFIFKR
jgi:hypothetical protein